MWRVSAAEANKDDLPEMHQKESREATV